MDQSKEFAQRLHVGLAAQELLRAGPADKVKVGLAQFTDGLKGGLGRCVLESYSKWGTFVLRLRDRPRIPVFVQQTTLGDLHCILLQVAEGSCPRRNSRSRSLAISARMLGMNK